MTSKSTLSEDNDVAVSHNLVFSINGQRFDLKSGTFDPAQTVSSFIRHCTRFNASTKLSCGEGGCGACTVMGSWYRTTITTTTTTNNNSNSITSNESQHDVIHRSFNACLRPLALCDGMSITTTQGLKSSSSKYHPVQECVARNNGSQCGFCTPGMVMALYSYLVAHPDAAQTSDAQRKVEQALDGNLCRCTGYRPLLTSAHELVGGNEEQMEPCFPVTQEFKARADDMLQLSGPSEQQWIRPVRLDQLRTLLDHCQALPVNIVSGHTSVGVARSVTAIGTDHSYESLLPNHAAHSQVNIDVSRVKELCNTGTLEDDQGHEIALIKPTNANNETVSTGVSNSSFDSASCVVFGSAVSMTDIKLYLDSLLGRLPSTKIASFEMITKHLERVAGQHVRNVGSWAGGLILARDRNFPSDLAVVLCAAGASIKLLHVGEDSHSDSAKFEWMSVEDFVLSNPTTDSSINNNNNNSVVVSLRIPCSESNRRYVTSFKSSLRRQNAHALINAAFSCDIDFISGTVSNARVVYGALATDRPLHRCTDTEAALNGVALGDDLLSAGMISLAKHVVPRLEAEHNYITIAQPDGKIAFRRELVMVFFYKFYVGLLFRFRRRVMDPRLFSACCDPEREAMQATQTFDNPDANLEPVGQPIPKLSALLQASGQAKYVGDLLPSAGGVALSSMPSAGGSMSDFLSSSSSGEVTKENGTESWWMQQPVLHGVIVCNDVAPTGTLTRIDMDAALSMPGVVRVLTATDISSLNGGGGGVNNVTFPGAVSATGQPQLPESLFVCVGEKVSYLGQPIGMVIATSLQLAEDAASRVQVEVDNRNKNDMKQNTTNQRSNKLSGEMKLSPTTRNDDGDVNAGEHMHVNDNIDNKTNVGNRNISVNGNAYVKSTTFENEEEKEEPAFCIQDAIRLNRFYAVPAMVDPISSGDAESALNTSIRTAAFTLKSGSMVHFYMEKQSSVAIPDEDRIVMHSSTQCPAMIRSMVANVLGISPRRVSVSVRRTGGAFGGKGSRAAIPAAAAALGAHLLGVPVSVCQGIYEDHKMSGARLNIKTNVDVGFDPATGKVTALKLMSHMGAGAFEDSAPTDTALEFSLALDNCYAIDHYLSHVKVCRLNVAPRTSTRAPGHLQSTYVMESVMDRVAELSGLDPSLVRQVNMYTDRNAITPYLQPIVGLGFSLPRVWKRIQQIKQERQLQHSIDAFNKANKWRKRGMAVAPVKYGIAPLRVGALVSIDADGTITIAHGGVELGQGIHTRVAQVAAYTLGAPLHCVRVADTCTDVVSQIGFTGGSATHGNAAEAVRLACLKIDRNLARAVEDATRRRTASSRQVIGEPLDAETKTKLSDTNYGNGSEHEKEEEQQQQGDEREEEKKEVAWVGRVKAGVSWGAELTVEAHYMGIGFKGDPSGRSGADGAWGSAMGQIFTEFCFGASCCVVEVDALSGEVSVLSADIVYDCGKSVNPALDVGQVEGAFVMGLGFYLHEEVLYSAEDGRVISNGTWEYKPPGAADVPIHFNVELLRDSAFARGALRSKAVGEPPQMLSYAAFAATRSAIAAARKERGLEPWAFDLCVPATVDRVQQALEVSKSLK